MKKIVPLFLLASLLLVACSNAAPEATGQQDTNVITVYEAPT